MKTSRHYSYQSIIDNKNNKKKNQIDTDEIRFRWFKKIISSKIKLKSITDIGSNLGYFCLRFNKHFNTNCVGYEYEKLTYKRANKLKKKNNNIKYFNLGLNLANLNSIRNTDLILNLNVLHHAGHMYDKKIVKIKNRRNNNSKLDWATYSSKYLNILSRKSKYMFFQTGNVNFNINHYQNSETFKILPSILRKGGWEIVNIGVVQFSKTNINYKTYKKSEMKKIPIVTCKKNPRTKIVTYYKQDIPIFKFKTGFLQRPLFWCISKNYK